MKALLVWGNGSVEHCYVNDPPPSRFVKCVSPSARTLAEYGRRAGHKESAFVLMVRLPHSGLPVYEEEK